METMEKYMLVTWIIVQTPCGNISMREVVPRWRENQNCFLFRLAEVQVCTPAKNFTLKKTLLQTMFLTQFPLWQTFL
ncbi:hypothetical protein TcasGA2_TC034639 [Tribolium castaneum]|uniref:Uncharacterized protein n=1 Tax=Tribolium castaneum TaxID=7070 RepID=A0A139WJJ5_TRICA|nr:hypothetical protein TcasGA2_TC034639 [Tribolium castaneum]